MLRERLEIDLIPVKKNVRQVKMKRNEGWKEEKRCLQLEAAPIREKESYDDEDDDGGGVNDGKKKKKKELLLIQ
jgi:hypothetical protein